MITQSYSMSCDNCHDDLMADLGTESKVRALAAAHGWNRDAKLGDLCRLCSEALLGIKPDYSGFNTPDAHG